MKRGHNIRCKQCGVSFYVKLYLIKSGRKKFCSRKCKGLWSSKNIKAETSYSWTGGKPKCLDCDKLLSTYNAKYCKNHARIGSRHSLWKGEKVTYTALHHWIKRYKGEPLECMYCGSIENLQWANISHFYHRNLDDWMSLCAKCHWHYDRDFGNSEILKNRFPERAYFENEVSK